jgi:DNA repair protein RadC
MGLREPGGVEIAGHLLARAGGRIARLPQALSDTARSGIGPAARDRLAAALELGRRATLESFPERPRMRGPEDVVAFLGPVVRELPHEEFHVLSLNTRHLVLDAHVASRGIVDASLVHPREVFAPALECRASAVILVHNHPSGDPEPSPEDRRVTEQMLDAGHILGIRVLDHVVIGNPGWRTVPFPVR